jgi:hypothetical protein
MGKARRVSRAAPAARTVLAALRRGVDHQHPAAVGAVAGPARSSSSLRVLTRSGSQRDSAKKLQPLHRGCCAPVTGSAPASAVSVLFA